MEKFIKLMKFCGKTSIQMIGDVLNTNRETVKEILHDALNMTNVWAKIAQVTSLRNERTTGKTFTLTSQNNSRLTH